MVNKRYLLLAVVGFGFVCNSCSTYDIGGMFKGDSSVKERFENSMSLPDRDFYPKKIALPGMHYAFTVATDLHIQDSDWDNVGKFLSFGTGKTPLLTILLGDYMYEAGSSLQRLSDSINAYKHQLVFPAIGNHEVYKKGYQNNYRKTFGPTCYYFWVENNGYSDLFIFLDSANGTLGTDQFRWLQSLLSDERTSARHCFVFTHANFFSPSGYFDAVSAYPIEEQMKLVDVFAKHHVTAVFTGHAHVHDETTVRGVKYITIGSWGQGKSKGEFCRVLFNTATGVQIRFNF